MLIKLKAGTVASRVVSHNGKREESSFAIVHVSVFRFVSVIVCCIYLCKQKIVVKSSNVRVSL